jgi:putative phosphoribosyl transferase
MPSIVRLRPGYTAGMRPFRDRRAAGRLLAAKFNGFTEKRPRVLALPRGGVPVAYEVAAALGVPLDVIVTRKIGYPPLPELGVGAIAECLEAADCLVEPVFDQDLMERLGISVADLAEVVAAEEAELARRALVYRGGRPPPDVAGRCVIVVDDGLATGVTARAALRSLRAAGAEFLVLAVPVAPPAAAAAMRAEADQVVTLATPRDLASVGECYESFGQLTDADVLGLLAPLRRVGAAHPATALGGALVLVQAAPGAVLLRPGDRVVKALQADWALLADRFGLALSDLALRLALAIRAKEQQQILATARRGILPPPVRAGKHSRLPTYLRHESITSTKLVKTCVTVGLSSLLGPALDLR